MKNLTGVAGFSWLLASGFFLSGCAAADSSHRSQPIDGKAVAYLANVAKSDGGCRPGGCQWRTFLPESGEDRLILTLPGIPGNVFWDEAFQTVHYRIRNRFFRARWQAGAEPEELFPLPFSENVSDTSLGRIWRSKDTGLWWMTSMRFEHSTFIAILWEKPDGEEWRRVEAHPTECECEACPCLDVFDKEWLEAAARNDLVDILNRQRVEHRLKEAGLTVDEDNDNQKYYFPSRSIEGRGVRVRVSLGDSLHAMAPLQYESSGDAGPKVIFAEDDACNPADQLGFEEAGPYLLVATEYIGSCMRVVDLRTGEIIKQAGPETRAAVWIPAPTSWLVRPP